MLFVKRASALLWLFVFIAACTPEKPIDAAQEKQAEVRAESVENLPPNETKQPVTEIVAEASEEPFGGEFVGLSLAAGIADNRADEWHYETTDLPIQATLYAPDYQYLDTNFEKSTDDAIWTSRYIRTIDGSYNNWYYPYLGQANTILRRTTPIDYADGQSTPAGETRPSARHISNVVGGQKESLPNKIGATDMVWQWGQFIDHDITLSPETEPGEHFDIEVPLGDAYFDPESTGEKEIEMKRSNYQTVEGRRRQLNAITSFVDGSMIYGSDTERAKKLRKLDGSAKLKTSDGNFLPFNTASLPNAPSAEIKTLFLAGDVRANEQTGLASMHTLFVREHNYIAAALKHYNPHLKGEDLFQWTRALVIAEIQKITYSDFLPLLIGKGAIAPYKKYVNNLDTRIANEFSTAAFRFGHTMLSENILRLDSNLEKIEYGHLGLRDSYFNPKRITDEGGIDPVLRGLSSQKAQDVDPYLVDDVRNFLFGQPGAGGFDLGSLNIQRGRDHGLSSYNDARQLYGLKKVTKFSDISSDEKIIGRLKKAYSTVDEIDLWVGGLSEDKVEGALMGPTFQRILADQFKRLRDGDRFWYESYLPLNLVKWVNNQSLAKIIRRNTDIGAEINDNVFITH